MRINLAFLTRSINIPVAEETVSIKGPLHSIEVAQDFLVMSRKFPPAKKEIRYEQIVSVEHKRLVDYGLLIWAIVPLALTYAFNSIQALKNIVQALLTEIEQATGSPLATIDTAIFWLTAILLIVSAYYILRFALSLGQRLVVYRAGKRPIAIPMALTGDAMKVLAEINKRVKAVAGMSKEEVERLIGVQIRSLFEERNRMQEELVSLAKVELKAAKTTEEKQNTKLKLAEGIEKLKANDDAIEVQLKKTGLTREDVFKKYRIKPPQADFIENVLKSEGVEL